MMSDPWVQVGGIGGAFGLAGFVLRQVKPIMAMYREALEDASTARNELLEEVSAAKQMAAEAKRDAGEAKQEAEACREREALLRAELAELKG